MVFFFFFKQKTAYEIKECDWSSDVCSSDLEVPATSEEVIVLPTGSVLKAKHSKDLEFTVNFYNDGNTNTFVPFLNCEGIGVTWDVDELFYLATRQKVTGGESQGFKFIINRGDNEDDESSPLVKTGTVICTISFYLEGTSGDEAVATKQVTLKVE